LITGYNTDVEYDGTVYHVQTEDKGMDHPVILSLVYLDGAILASKRSPYDDLVIGGFDEEILVQRLQRQHKLICAAVRAGRIDDLKRLSARDAPAKSPQYTESAAEPPPVAVESTEPDVPVVTQEADAVAGLAAGDSFLADGAEEAEEEELLHVTLMDDQELRAGDSVTLRVMVSRAARNGRVPVPKARVILKTLGTSFRPESTISTTDHDGIALLFALLPKFTSGRAAILIRAEVEGESAELRRIIQRA
jgi:hypothetical protein